MATKDLNSSDIKTQEELEEIIITCCICTDVYTDPKALPCIHTFCMKCLQETGIQIKKGPGDEMPCPICRRLFKIPSEGFPGLSKNFFIERLIQVSKLTDPSDVAKALHTCSLCLEESKEQEEKETPIAHICCVVCKTNLCEECCNEHRKLKATKNHKLMPINEYESDQNLKSDLAAMVCEVHAQRFVDVYCADCKTVVCAICFIEEHNSHKGSHVKKCVDGYRKQIENNTETMNGCITQAQMKKAELVKVKEQMQKRAGSLESDIDNRKRHIKQFVDKHAGSLFQDLCYERQSRLKEIQMATDDIDAYLSNLESYNSYCQRIMAKGSASDICSAHSDLSVRAMELQEQCQPIIERGIKEFNFCFRQSELEDEDGDNLVGEIEKEGDLKPKKTSKKMLLEEQRKEIDLLRQKNEQLSEWRANYDAHMEKLKQDQENNKTEFGTLQVSNDKLKQELDVEKTTSNAPQTSNDKKKYGDYTAYIEKLKQDLEKNKAEFNALQVGNDKLKQELDAEKPIMKTLEANAEKLISELFECRYKSDPVLVQTIRTERREWIRGLAVLDNELFVLSYESSEVEVFDSLGFRFSRRLTCKGLTNPEDMGSCDINKCLYILDHNRYYDQSDEIFRVPIQRLFPNRDLIKKWSTGKAKGTSLSVTDKSNIILTVYDKNKLKEYSPDGQLIREVNLSDARIRHPWHAIKLTNGNFVVSHGNGVELHRVCVVDADGKLQKSFGGECGSNIGQLSLPGHLYVDGNGFVMVIDGYDSRISLLNSDLEFKREILSKGKHGLKQSGCFLLDESKGRLFVSGDHSNQGQIFAFDFI